MGTRRPLRLILSLALASMICLLCAVSAGAAAAGTDGKSPTAATEERSRS